MQKQKHLQYPAWKHRRTIETPLEDMVKFTPYSASKAARSEYRNLAAGTHVVHTAFTLDELYRSHEKIGAFYELFYTTFARA